MLVRLLKKAEKEKRITGLKVARNSPPVSHVFFTDDSMFYCKENDAELDQIVRVLDSYSLVSG